MPEVGELAPDFSLPRTSDSLESHAALCGALGGCPVSALASDAKLSVARAHRAISDDDRSGIRSTHVVDADLTLIRRIPWYQPGNVGQFMEIFQALGME